ncbi:hypothetical protein MBRU_11875 [Mycolicibacterium brumae DSM 44177]|nr:hypothetical protein MBRU_11875 [Mycolicibacterium brumae DSM 44177]
MANNAVVDIWVGGLQESSVNVAAQVARQIVAKIPVG